MIDPKQIVSVKDISLIAKVRPSAVSNWISRHKDFPTPIAIVGNGEIKLFNKRQIISWLEKRKK